MCALRVYTYTLNRTLVSGDDFVYHSPKGRLRENNVYNRRWLSFGVRRRRGKKSRSTDFVIPCVPCTTTLSSRLSSACSLPFDIVYRSLFLSLSLSLSRDVVLFSLACLTLLVFLPRRVCSSRCRRNNREGRTERRTAFEHTHWQRVNKNSRFGGRRTLGF